MPEVIYAIGDVHGRDDLLAELHISITQYHKFNFGARAATIIHIGDYIDGGPESVNVIDRLIRGVPGFEMVCLMGNHEDLMLACTTTNDRQVWWNWLSNGGDATLRSLGISFRFGGYDPLVLIQSLGQKRLQWLRNLRLHYQTRKYLFVHAGISPGVEISKQEKQDLLWIRGRFIDSNADHGVCVVHGHTPSDYPVVTQNRIGIDTGATSNGLLTAVVLVGEENPTFLYARGAPTKM